MKRILFLSAIVGMSLCLPSCDSSSPAAPEGTVIYLTAEYREADTETGNFTAVIRALLLNEERGDPQRGVGVLFLVTSGPGRLNSAGKIVETNDDGEAFDVIIGTGATSDNPVTVTATSGGITADITLDAEGATSQIKTRPKVDLRVSPNPANVNQDVTFDVSQSTDPDGTIQTWSINYGDSSSPENNISFSSTKSKTHKYTQTGTYTASVTLKDNDNQQSNKSVTVTVN